MAIPSPPSKQTRNTVITSFVKFLRRVIGLLTIPKLPHVARKTCEIYLEGTNTDLQAKCRRVLQTRLRLSPKQLHHFFDTSMGALLLEWFEGFLQWPDHHNPKQALKELLQQMATDPEGLSLLSALRHCPETLQLNLDHLLLTAKRVKWLMEATQVTADTIHRLAIAETQHIPTEQFAALPDLRTVGEYEVRQSHLTLPGRRQATHPEDKPRSLKVVCYEPHPWPSQPTPVIVQSHGLASSPEDVDLYACHLASYGYFVVAPQHPGSDVQQVRRMLAGNTPEVFKFSAFIDRPLDISYLLDELGQIEGRSWTDRLNLEQVGIMGYSFGAYISFALAGAALHFKGLERACGLPIRDPNLSLLLQCQALVLPQQHYPLRDTPIQAIFSLDSVGSEAFGTVGLAQIQVPVMLVVGFDDVVAPLILEQIRIFQGLKGLHQYLVLMPGKSHIRDMQRFARALDLKMDWTPQSVSSPEKVAFVDDSIKALSVAFLGQHLQPQQADTPYLSADYATYLSQPPYALWLISEKSQTALDEALRALDEEQIGEFPS